MLEPEINVYQGTEEMVTRLADLLQKTSDEAINERGHYYIGISGGSMIAILKEALQKVVTNFTKWKIFFNDERVVPFESKDSTYGVCKKELIGAIKDLTEENFVPIGEDLTPPEAAVNYMIKLMSYFNPGVWPKFDTLLLGMGDDGHTCSIFPGHKLINENDFCVSSLDDSPKPPRKRITFTYVILNNAHHVIFVVAGEGKASAVKRVLVDKDDKLPATRVHPRHGKLYWILDQAAAKHLPGDLLK